MQRLHCFCSALLLCFVHIPVLVVLLVGSSFGIVLVEASAKKYATMARVLARAGAGVQND